MNQDVDHLRLLSIFNYVLAGLVLFFSLAPLFYFLFGVAVFSGELGGPEEAERFMGTVVMVFGGAMIVASYAYLTCLVLAARYLGKRKNIGFCMAVAAVSCIFVPFGTVLGVFTLTVLSRDSVKTMFAEGPGRSVGE